MSRSCGAPNVPTVLLVSVARYEILAVLISWLIDTNNAGTSRQSSKVFDKLLYGLNRSGEVGFPPAFIVRHYL